MSIFLIIYFAIAIYVFVAAIVYPFALGKHEGDVLGRDFDNRKRICPAAKRGQEPCWCTDRARLASILWPIAAPVLIGHSFGRKVGLALKQRIAIKRHDAELLQEAESILRGQGLDFNP